MPNNDIGYELDPSSVLAALKQLNTAFQMTQKNAADAGAKWDQAFTTLSDKLVKANDRARVSQERYVRSVEMTAAAYGKTGVDRLIQQRDQIIRRLGDEEKLVNRVREAYARMIQQEKNNNTSGNPAMTALRGARDLFEGRTGYGEVMVGKALTQLSGLPLVLGSATAAFGVYAAAAYEAAKSLAEFGVETNNVALRTGLTVKEVGQFSFAAKAVGADVSVFERAMRGLSQAVEEQSAAGDKARGWLEKFGVDIRGVREGTVSTADLFRQIGAGIVDIKNPIEKARAEIELLKRSGIESGPVFENLIKNLKIAEDHGFGASREEIDQMLKYKEQLTIVEETWSEIVRHMKEGLVASAAYLIQGRNNFAGAVQQGASNAIPLAPPDVVPNSITDLSMFATRIQSFQEATKRGNVQAYQDYLSRQSPEEKLRQAERDLSKLGPIDQYSSLEDRQKVETQQHIVDLRKQELKVLEQQKSVTEALRKLDIDAADRLAHPYGRMKADEMLEQIARLPSASASQIESARARLEPLRRQEAIQNLRNVGIKVNEGTAGMGNLDAFGRLTFNSGDTFSRVSQIGGHGAVPFDEQLLAQGEKSNAAQSRLYLENLRQSSSDAREQAGFLSSTLAGDLRLRTGAQESDARIRSLTGPQTPQARLNTEREIANIRANAAKEEYDVAKSKIEGLYSDQATREAALFDARIKYEEEVGKTRQDYQQQAAQELRRELDEIKGATDSLLHTLFTSPSKFGKQLGTTLLGAATRPFSNAFSSAAANFLQPMLFGGGAAAAMSGGPQVTNAQIGSSAIGNWMLSPGWSMTGRPDGDWTDRDWSSWTGGGGPSDSDSPYYSASAPGGTGGFFPGSVGLPGGFGGGRTGGGGGGLLGGFGNLKSLTNLSSLRSMFWNENLNLAPGVTVAASSLGLDGKLAGVLTSKGAATAEIGIGSQLAMAGILGGSRGTGRGVVESGLGGALTGAGIGTLFAPGFGTVLGAGIGALAGLGVGFGEMLAGVESPEEEAKRLVNSVYHVGIGTAMAKQIASIAQQSYGGMVSVAVRSPEVRQLLSLYVTGSGQSFPLSASSPHGASFSSVGGQVTQDATYQYGNPYAYTSQFPLNAGGGFGAGGVGQISAPGTSNGNTYLSFNIGDGSIGHFLDGNYFTPDRTAANYSSALRSNNQRVQNSLDLFDPGSVAL